jgi:hypothetical protein
MSELNLSLKHHTTIDEARRRLEQTVRDVQGRFGSLIQKAEWSADGNTVTLSGTGFTGRVWVDPQEVHALMDVPLLGQLLGSPIITELKGLLERQFGKQLPPP